MGSSRPPRTGILHEGIDVLTAQATDLHQAQAQAQADGLPSLTLNGTLIGANLQVIADPTGFPLWVSPVEPGSTHETTAARKHCVGALYPAAAADALVLTTLERGTR